MEPENDDENKVNITGLTYGEKYEVVVVARDGAGNEKEGTPVTVTLGQTPGQLMCSQNSTSSASEVMLTLLTLVLVINNY